MPSRTTPPDEGSGRTWLERLEWGLLQVGLFVGAVVWTAFWVNVARLQWVEEGSAVNVMFLLATLIAPAVILYVDYALSVTDRTNYQFEVLGELPTPGTS